MKGKEVNGFAEKSRKEQGLLSSGYVKGCIDFKNASGRAFIQKCKKLYNTNGCTTFSYSLTNSFLNQKKNHCQENQIPHRQT